MPGRTFLTLAILALAAGLHGQEAQSVSSEDCASCHEPAARVGKRKAGEAPGFNARALKASPHADVDCTSCHADIKELPHPEKLARVDCGGCHGEEQKQYTASVHGKKAAQRDAFAPGCTTCHGTHNILRPSTPGSPTSTMETPRLCGSCHREGTPVSLTRQIHQSNILENYVDSIHGEGLFKRGLVVTAVCTSCHTSHFVLPHSDPRSSIAKDNIAKTCTHCHAQIETVHRKVIRGELWEKQPHMIPACVDCHSPHKVRKVFYTQGMADQDCLRCHGEPELKVVRGGQAVSLFTNRDELSHSRHAKIACVQCHTGGSPADATRPCRTMTARVDCSICHTEVVDQYRTSRHGQLAAQGSPDAPACRDCHSPHGTLGRNDPKSPTFSRNVPTLCANCHRTGQKAAVRYKGTQSHIIENYLESIHGKGLVESGLTVTANCVDCHTAHHELAAADSQSSVNRANIARTCSKCHRGIYELFTASIHSPTVSRSREKLPVCADCHSAHSIQRTDLSNFRLHIMDQCGRCHEKIAETYFDTFHGKVSKLGYLATAKCYDCHGSHDILPVTDQRSRLSRANIVKTCAQCHPGSHRQFAGYLTHATHHDPKRYPLLFYTFWGMASLLVGTLVFAGSHTALWLHRSLRENPRAAVAALTEPGEVYVRRFTALQRNLHLMVIVSFLGLALTGMTLKFSYAPWAKVLARVLGGFEAAGLIHRFCAVMTFTYFGLHLWDVARQKKKSGRSWLKFIFGPESMMLNLRDWREFVGSIKWFVKRGPRPRYGRWTYWEKFDYFAVFWGVAVIGTTGLILWFPTVFTRFMPGWMVNVATTIHSDEALLAVCFIFSIHFFNTHFRPEKFPIDTVIFTQGVPLEELKHDRPREYQELVESGELESLVMPPPPPATRRKWRRFGFTALGIGLFLIVLMLYAFLFVYR
ncbi:MAG TPA: cytochrome c3 family protein [Thermoanaerobaculia bacterium]|nr:cytochrome c3 family protein [Thermoanaerobaculia bacterium]